MKKDGMGLTKEQNGCVGRLAVSKGGKEQCYNCNVKKENISYSDLVRSSSRQIMLRTEFS